MCNLLDSKYDGFPKNLYKVLLIIVLALKKIDI